MRSGSQGLKEPLATEVQIIQKGTRGPADSLPVTIVTFCDCRIAAASEVFAWARKARSEFRGNAMVIDETRQSKHNYIAILQYLAFSVR